MSKLVAYLRVSTDEQGDSGLGLEAQAAAIKVYCAAQGHELAGMVREIESARGKRPILDDVLAHIEQGTYDGLIVAKLDRLSRSVVQANEIHDRLDKTGAALIALDLNVDTSTAVGRMMMNVLATVAQWERDTIGERTRSALRAKAARGEPVGRKRVIPDEVRALAQELRREGCTYSQINERLLEAGHLPPNGVRRWQLSTIQRLLSQPVRETVPPTLP